MANPPWPFHKEDNDSHWVDIGDKKTANKATQALRKQEL